MENKKQPRLPKVWEALIPIIFMMVVIIIATIKWEIEPHIPLVLASVVAAIVAWRCGYTWEDIAFGMLDSIKRTVEAFLIILCVGMLIGAWVWSGTMPAMVYYGLDLIAPRVFLVVGCILCGIVGLATGSSWTASGTVGVALMGIAAGLGIPAPIAAGMIISGAYMGDKWSPLSDSTNVAAAAAETPLYDHVRAMMTTTLPSLCIALVIYGVLGFVLIDANGYDPTQAKELQAVIAANFNLNPCVLLPILVILFGAWKRIPAIPSLLLAAAVGGIFAMIFQGTTLPEIINAFQYGYTADTGNALADKLLSRGGEDSMLWTISLIMFAMCFGGILEKCGYVEVLLGPIVRRVKSVGGLVTAMIITGIVCDIVLTDQYLAIMVPSRMFQKSFDERGLSRSFLSRTSEDAATLWSPMIPWNGCGAYQSATLGVSNWAFAPYAFMNLINPIYAIVITYLGIGIKYKEYDNLSGEELKAAKAKKKAEFKAAKAAKK